MSQLEITLKDWSDCSEHHQHALFCVAYRLISNGETRRSAIENTLRTTGVSKNTLNKKVKKHIRITVKELSNAYVLPEDVPGVWAAAYRKVTATN